MCTFNETSNLDYNLEELIISFTAPHFTSFVFSNVLNHEKSYEKLQRHKMQITLKKMRKFESIGLSKKSKLMVSFSNDLEISNCEYLILKFMSYLIISNFNPKTVYFEVQNSPLYSRISHFMVD